VLHCDVFLIDGVNVFFYLDKTQPTFAVFVGRRCMNRIFSVVFFFFFFVGFFRLWSRNVSRRPLLAVCSSQTD
jgi:hypothetical protein